MSDYVIGVQSTVVLFITDSNGDPVVDPSFEVGDVKILNSSDVYVNTSNQPAVVPSGDNRVELVLTASETSQSLVSLKLVDQTDPKAWADQRVELRGEDNATQTTNVTWPAASSSTEQLADDYGNVLAEDRFIIEHQENSKRARTISPSEMRELQKLRREEDAIAKRRSGGMFKQVVD